MGFSLLSSLLTIAKTHSLQSIPGIVNMLISIISILIIYFFYSRSTLNSVTDFITGPGNRRLYAQKISDLISSKKDFYLVCVEIENFKLINEEYGIHAGDYILRDVASKLSAHIEKGEMIFKLTGGMFALILNEKTNPEERLRGTIKSEVIAIPPEQQKASSSLHKDAPLEKNCTVALNAGVAFSKASDNTRRDSVVLMRTAEIALGEALRTADKRICLYDENMENQEIKQNENEFLIKEALENNYFYLVYQPQYTTSEKKLRGFETLIRCRKPDGTIVSPGIFIPAAEKTNLIMKIDDYVLRRAMEEFKPVLDASNKDLTISINVSAKNIGSENFSERIKKMLEETNFPAKNLEIEITEYSFAESMETTIDNILSLRKLGVQIALDDFGTGYTSIAQLMKLPINLLKIDKSLIDDIETSQTMRDMVDSVIYMGHIMNCEVISEGVETECQLELLKKHKCDFIQGFIWGKPQSFADAEILCQTN
jgi:diguanylate cyclase (GGDEF)-like protein